MSFRGLSVLSLGALLGLVGCLSTPVEVPREQPSPVMSPPSGAPATETPPVQSLPPEAPPLESPPPPGSGASACTPRSCAQALASCGAASDGCGGTLECGACAAAQTCTEEGPFKLCGSPGGAPDSAWSRTWPHRVAAFTTDAHANIAVLSATEEGTAHSMLDPNGQLLWARSALSHVFDFRGVSVAPSGELLTWGYRDGQPGWSVSYRFDAQGLSPENIGWCGDECSMGPHYQDAQGNLLYFLTSSWSSRVGYKRAGGGGWALSHVYTEKPPTQDPFDYSSAVLDAEGAVLVVASLQGQGTFQGRPFGSAGRSSGLVMKLSSEGQLLWGREFTGGFLTSFHAGASGSVVVGAFNGVVTWEGGELRAARTEQGTSFLAALDARGQVIWAQVLPFHPKHVAVSPAGRIAVANDVFEPRTERRRSVHLREYDVEGHLRWSRTWVPRDDSGSIWLSGLAWSEDAWVLGGGSRGTISFGDAASWTATDGNGFVVKLQPTP